ncbi:tRNA1(Val) (adenine(37)-N6)-methyltransferase [Sphingobacterium paludis]|uniref:tRNA1(Val) (adenine(37)-N6)-methyltransferase n=1 Tax=Sphingobacterium paludis TaxID=1476465 RepID=A0A4V3E244_9SPHI|nr:methyltransferase [Sphingobacterium paludis]TDS15828.1 tRNA1Val (adenine37-N6)-methyltransferase [Sphingobacterium paludis]
MASIFKFKQFDVDQGDCAMKINTDGVILGASAFQANARRILDVGTGTGVVALMLAQRHPEAFIDAVEIDEAASRQADYNFRRSCFASRLRSITGAFQDVETQHGYDLIVSNPPFYTNSLHNPDPRKKLAKHTDEAFFESLLDFVGKHLSPDGKFQCILPVALADKMIGNMLAKRALHFRHRLSISSYPGEDPIRSLITIQKDAGDAVQEDLLIYQNRGEHTMAYRTLLKPYFLAY